MICVTDDPTELAMGLHDAMEETSLDEWVEWDEVPVANRQILIEQAEAFIEANTAEAKAIDGAKA